MRRLTVLLFRDEGPGEDENIGCVGNYGSEWRHAPEMFERFNVVDEATHERLVEALRGVLDTPRGSSGRIIIEDDEEEELATLLAQLEAGKRGEL